MDFFLKKETFYFWYKKAEGTIRKPWLASILIVLVLLNWIWNMNGRIAPKPNSSTGGRNSYPIGFSNSKNCLFFNSGIIKMINNGA